MSKYSFAIFFLVLFVFVACRNAEENSIPVNLDNDTICDVTLKKNDCPKGNFILMDIPSSYPNEDLWVHAFLNKDNTLIYPKTYLTNKPSKHVTHNAIKLTRLKYLFDNLSFGVYEINYVSVFQDTMV